MMLVLRQAPVIVTHEAGDNPFAGKTVVNWVTFTVNRDEAKDRLAALGKSERKCF